MHMSRLFKKEDLAYVFAQGLQSASDGSVHTVTVVPMACNPQGATHEVRWVDEDNSRRRLQHTKPKGPISPKDYVREHKGLVCPFCLSRDYGWLTAPTCRHPEEITHVIHCENPDCEAQWTNVYELSGYEIRAYPRNWKGEEDD